VIHFGQDGGKDHQGALYAVHNTIVTPFAAPVVELSAPGAEALIANNLIWDGGARARGQAVAAARGGASIGRVTGAGNWLSAGFAPPAGSGLVADGQAVAEAGGTPAFRDPAGGDYGLLAPLPSRRPDLVRPLESLKLPESPGSAPARLTRYKHPQRAEPRPDRDKPEAGACDARAKP
jgi:hypothetical protein